MAAVPMFGQGQMVIEEVIMKESKAMNGEDQKKSDLGYVCASLHEACGGSAGLFCCPGLHCITSPDSPPETPGVCMPQCAQFGKECSRSVPIVCCSGLSCFTPPGSGDGAPGTCIVPF